MLNFVCVNWGLKFDPKYVIHLYNMSQRHLTIPHKFILFTDRPKLHKHLIGDNVEIRKLPYEEYQGYWQKLTLFSPEANLNGTCLYMDLDVVIKDNIDCFATYGEEDSFCVMRDFGKPQMWYNSSILKFNNINATEFIWHPFLKNKKEDLKMQGDQNVITTYINKQPGCKKLQIYPDLWTQSYKWLDRSQNRFHKGSWTFEEEARAKVAVFHGNPKPHESKEEWVVNNWK
jgi:hypothetical protein